MLSFGACQGRISTLQAYSSAARTPSVTRHGVQVITVRPFKSQHPLLHRRTALPSRHCGLCRATSPGEATEKEALVKRDTEHVDQLTSTTENEHNYANGKENGVAEATADAAAQPANQNLYIAVRLLCIHLAVTTTFASPHQLDIFNSNAIFVTPNLKCPLAGERRSCVHLGHWESCALQARPRPTLRLLILSSTATNFWLPCSLLLRPGLQIQVGFGTGFRLGVDPQDT